MNYNTFSFSFLCYTLFVLQSEKKAVPLQRIWIKRAIQHPPSQTPGKGNGCGCSIPNPPIYKNYNFAMEQNILNELREIKAAALLAAKPILTTDEAAAFMGVTKSHLYKLVCAKKVPYYKSEGGKFTYFKRTELEQWLTAVRVPTSDELNAHAAMRCATKGGA